MAATQASPNDRPSSQDKVAVNQMEHVFTTDDPALMKQPVIEKVDEFGAHTKTDPKEIALVRKIDWYILVSVDTHTYLAPPRDGTFTKNPVAYELQQRTAHALVHVLPQLSRPQRHD